MSLITTRQVPGTEATVKGSPLNNSEVDNNFISINNDVIAIKSYYVTGVEKIANGGTGASTANAAKVNLNVITSLTGSEILPVGTTAQRDGTPSSGYMRFNSDISQFEGYNGSSWASVGGSAISNDVATSSNLYPIFVNSTTGTALNVYTSNAKYLYKPSTGELQAPELVANNGIVVNNATVSSNYTIAAGNNAMSVGPITIAGGVVVTVTSGQKWVVL